MISASLRIRDDKNAHYTAHCFQKILTTLKEERLQLVRENATDGLKTADPLASEGCEDGRDEDNLEAG